MNKPEYWDGYAYPHEDPKVWISFGAGRNRSVTALISELGPVDTTGKGHAWVKVYAALEGDWASEDEAREAVNNATNTVILELSL